VPQPQFLTLDEVETIHASMISLYGGSMGVRDEGLLDSALAQPMAMFGGEFVHEDVFVMAAAYLFHLVKNHPFIDGNKRVGGAAALSFLDINGVEIVGLSNNDEFADMVLAVSEGRMRKSEVAEWFRTRAREA
jgi:death-on-curing protein